MFDQLFADRRTVQRYVAAPLPAQRLRYLHHRAEQGAAPATLKSVAAYQLAVIRTMGCVFRSKPITDSGPNRSLIPVQTDH